MWGLTWPRTGVLWKNERKGTSLHRIDGNGKGEIQVMDHESSLARQRNASRELEDWEKLE